MTNYLSVIISWLATVVIILLLEVVCVKYGWEIFMTPVFHLPELTWEQAIGFAILASSIGRHIPTSHKA